MNRLSPEKRVGILHDMVESKSLRGISRTRNGNARRSSSDARNKPVALNTVYKLLADAGDAAIDFLDAKLCNLPCTRIEADEAYTWVKMHPVRVRKAGGTDEEKGVFWIWIALDPVSKLVAHYYIGGRGYADGQVFIEGLAERISGRFQLTTDSLASYRRPIENSFGANIDYATVKNKTQKRSAFERSWGTSSIVIKRKKAAQKVLNILLPKLLLEIPTLRSPRQIILKAFFKNCARIFAAWSERPQVTPRT